MNQQKTYPLPSLRAVIVVCIFVWLLPITIHSQAKLSFGQQVYLMKTLKPSLKRVGIITFNVTDDEAGKFVRAAMALGVKTTVARANDDHEISGIYRKLVAEHNADMIWIPEGDDKLILGVGMEFLLASTIEDKVGLCVPTRDGVSKGALCCFQMENNKYTVYINQRIAEVVGAAVPSQQDSRITYIVQ